MKKKVTKTRKIFLFSFLALTFGLFFWFYLLKLPSFNSVLYYAASRVHKYKKIPEIFDHTHQAFHIKYGKNVAGISPDYPGTQLIRKVQAHLEPAEKLEIKVNSRDAVKFENVFKEIREKKIPLSDTYKDIEVPAAIHYKNQYHMAIIHLKGINPDHYVGDKWSFKVKIKSDSHIDGMTKFSLQNPIVRKGLNDWMLQSYARQNGLVALRSKVVNLTYNGKNLGAYLLEEHFDKRVLENSKRREGLILKLSARPKFYGKKKYFKKRRFKHLKKSRKVIEKKLADFFEGRITADQVFDLDMMARYFATTEIYGGFHGHLIDNFIAYYNPITRLIEPIPYDNDAYGLSEICYPFIRKTKNFCLGLAEQYLIHGIFLHKKFFRLYLHYLNRYSQIDRSQNLQR